MRSVACACPYTLLVAALIRWGRLVLGREDAKRQVRERELVSGVTTGRNIALIGFFCPIFWVSVFSGATAATIRFNALHSGAVVLAGLLWMVKSLVQVELARRRQVAPSERALVWKFWIWHFHMASAISGLTTRNCSLFPVCAREIGPLARVGLVG